MKVKDEMYFYIFYNSLCRELYNNNNDENGNGLNPMNLGKNIGRRITDDFCAGNQILKQKSTEKEFIFLIYKFFKSFLDLDVKVDNINQSIDLNDDKLYKYGKELGILMICGILTYVFNKIMDFKIEFTNSSTSSKIKYFIIKNNKK